MKHKFWLSASYSQDSKDFSVSVSNIPSSYDPKICKSAGRRMVFEGYTPEKMSESQSESQGYLVSFSKGKTWREDINL